MNPDGGREVGERHSLPRCWLSVHYLRSAAQEQSKVPTSPRGMTSGETMNKCNRRAYDTSGAVRAVEIKEESAGEGRVALE